MVQTTSLNFNVLDNNDCQTLAILDISYYSPLQQVTGNILQVLVPGYLKPVEVYYNQSGVTVLNSNNLKVTNVIGPENYVDLPDGAYVIKMSFCPYDQHWVEKVFYRTCKIECKYDTAILQLDLNNCTTCYDAKLAETINTIRLYIDGCKANARNNNLRVATQLYNVANKMLDDIINCDCYHENRR